MNPCTYQKLNHFFFQEPPPVKFVKPLPKPIEQSRKKRGGKRVRKMKERYALTEFRKNANRLNFADVSVVYLSIYYIILYCLIIFVVRNYMNQFFF